MFLKTDVEGHVPHPYGSSIDMLSGRSPYSRANRGNNGHFHFKSFDSDFEEDIEEMLEEVSDAEEDPDETSELLATKTPSRPPIELKPLPSGLRYAFLNSDVESPVIISDKLSEEETNKLIAILEKHRSVLGYTLQDLKGISPALCTHRIPLDPTIAHSREPQRRLNNAMREVVKKEVLKLLDAGIIYPILHSEWVSPVQVVPKKGRKIARTS